MKSLDDLIKDGFYVSEATNNRGNIADYSLLGSLRSFFSTSEDLDWYLSQQDWKSIHDDSKEILVGSYARDACNAITQFQHFFELFLKDILLEQNKLLVYDASQKPDLLLKLIDGERISNTELEKMHLIECRETILRIKAMCKANKLASQYLFIANYFDLFEKLNVLRNRIAHRGAFIINPSALNEIFGRYVFPFINELEGINGYENIKSWAFNLKTQELNPFEAITKEYLNEGVDENKIHLFKLIGAAAYSNKIDFDLDQHFSIINDEIRDQAKSSAITLAEQNMTDVVDCPVCGCKSFVREMDCYVGEDEFGNEAISEPYVFRISCGQCGFHINNWLMNKLKDMDVPMPDYSQW
jgi:hypothetical protein